MAVKQTNTENNGAPSAVNGNASTSAQNSSNATGTKMKINNSNYDAGGSVNIIAEQPCCNVPVGPLIMPKPIAIDVIEDNQFDGNINKETTDIASFLDVMTCIVSELKKQQMAYSYVHMVNYLGKLIVELSRVHVPRQTPNDLKNFKKDINKVCELFKNLVEQKHYIFYLRTVCSIITRSDEPPSCAVAIIFQLFDIESIFAAVQTLLDQKTTDQNIRKTVRLLIEWLRSCNFCENLHYWIRAILNGLQDQQKHQVLVDIALDNIEHLSLTLIVPVLRPKAAPIVFHMLLYVHDTPLVFHKILPKLPKIVNCLKQQSNNNEPHCAETKVILQQLVDVTSALMVRFCACDDIYAPVEQLLRDFPPSFDYLRYSSMSQHQQDHENWSGISSDDLLEQKNAKVGLVNLGNTCYMNSVLQALAMTKEFARQILLAETKSPLLIKMQQQIALMLYSVRCELTPSRVLSATRPPGFSAGVQQDSSEFLGYLLETLHEEEILFRKKFSTSKGIEIASSAANGIKQTEESSVYGEGASAVFNETTLCRNAEQNIIRLSTEANVGNFKNTHAQLSNVRLSSAIGVVAHSAIETTFTGKIATTYKCLTCGWKSRNIDHFRDFQLSFPEVKNECAPNYSVQDLIDYYCSPEKLYGENQYFCETCKKLSDAERYINVITAPKNLILTLKHFQYDQKCHMRAKLMHKVFHDEKVSVKVCSAETLEEIASVHYDIYAGIVHSGFSMDSGHYYTYAADASNKWYKFNDSIVTPTKSEELHNLTPPNTPYILFYQMGARSNEAPEAVGSTKVIKVDIPIPLQLDDLPRNLRDYINHDNYTFTEERKSRSAKRNASARQLMFQTKDNRGRGFDDDDDDMPPPAGGCGGNTMNINMNRFVY